MSYDLLFEADEDKTLRCIDPGLRDCVLINLASVDKRIAEIERELDEVRQYKSRALELISWEHQLR